MIGNVAASFDRQISHRVSVTAASPLCALRHSLSGISNRWGGGGQGDREGGSKGGDGGIFR